MKIEGLPVIEVDESEEISVAVRADDLLEGDTADPRRHPIALRRQGDVDDARVTKNEALVRRGKKWFRYDAPDKRLFKQLQKTLTAPEWSSKSQRLEASIYGNWLLRGSRYSA